MIRGVVKTEQQMKVKIRDEPCQQHLYGLLASKQIRTRVRPDDSCGLYKVQVQVEMVDLVDLFSIYICFAGDHHTPDPAK